MATQVLLISGSSWSVPDDCTSATVECIGGGAGGGESVGGAGADYAKLDAISLTPGANIPMQIGAAGTSGGAGGDTWFSTAGTVQAKGGGSASTSVGDTTFAGGTTTSAGGGGAAGPSGAGGAASGNTGGTGDGGTTPAGANGTEWGTAGSGGGGTASVPSGPAVFVQGAYLAPTDPNPLVLPDPPTAGNRLILSGYLGDTRTFSAPDDSWGLVTSFHDVADARLITVYTKISDGTEQTIDATFSGGTLHGASCVEFSNAGSIEATIFTGVAPQISPTQRRDFGPTNAPNNANAIPLIISGWEFGGNTYTFDSGWAGLGFASNADRLIPHYAYRIAPPNAAVSMSLTYSSGTNNSSPTPYLCLWIDPK